MKSTISVLLVAIAVVTGCAKRQRLENPSIFTESTSAFTLTILLDTSRSFQDEFVGGGKAYNFCMAVLDRYDHSKVGSEDEIVIAQISGADRALLFKGSPQQLRQQFSGPEEFAKFLNDRSDPNGSLVHQSMARTLEYLLSDRRFVSGQKKSALFVLSDMIDNGSEGAAKQEALNLLTRYGQAGGCVGLYFVDQSLFPEWNHLINSCGFKHSVVEIDIDSPTLPDFDH